MTLIGTSNLRAVSQALGSSHGSPAFSIQSLSCLLFSMWSYIEAIMGFYEPGGFGKLVGAEEALTAPRVLACRVGVAPSREASCLWWQHCCFACSYFSEAKGCGQCSWQHAMVILQAGQSTKIELLPPCGSGRGCKQCCSWAPLAQRVPTAPRGLPQLPSLLYLVSFSCMLSRSCSFSPQLSHSYDCSLYMYIFEFAHERGWVLCPPRPTTILDLFIQILMLRPMSGP